MNKRPRIKYKGVGFPISATACLYLNDKASNYVGLGGSIRLFTYDDKESALPEERFIIYREPMHAFYLPCILGDDLHWRNLN